MPNLVNVVCGGPVTYCAKNHKFGDFRRMRREGRERERGEREGTDRNQIYERKLRLRLLLRRGGGGRKMNRRRRIKK